MESKGLSAYDLAKAAGLSHTAIYAWRDERGKEPPKRDNVERVAKALGITYRELWGAEISGAERTRLVRLEGFAQRVRELLNDLAEDDAALRVAEPPAPNYDAEIPPAGFAPLEEDERPARRKGR